MASAVGSAQATGASIRATHLPNGPHSHPPKRFDRATCVGKAERLGHPILLLLRVSFFWPPVTEPRPTGRSGPNVVRRLTTHHLKDRGPEPLDDRPEEGCPPESLVLVEAGDASMQSRQERRRGANHCDIVSKVSHGRDNQVSHAGLDRKSTRL